MADEFIRAVEDGVRLSKRIYFGKDRSITPPKPIEPMIKSSSSQSLLPTALMVYAVIPDPVVVDNPDIPSYQPHVHGRCDPPALIPLQMNGIEVEVDCVLDTAVVKMSGSWRVHCVMGSRKCQLRVAIPMGEEGSILGIEVEVPEKSYFSKLVAIDDNDMEKVPKYEDGGFLKPHIFIFTIPEVDGGSNLSITVRWSQKLSYQDGEFTLTVPYSFPEFVTPVGKKISKKEKIRLDVNAGPGTEVLCKTISHPLKELRRHGEKLSFLYDTEVLTWSSSDFVFTYGVSSSLSGSVILQSPMKFDIDQREMFCISLFAGSKQNKKVFRKEVIFVVDISESMRGKPLEGTKNALASALSKLDQGDSFNVIAFNDEVHLFSLSMEPGTKKAIDKVTEWMSMNMIAQGGTNILLPLNQALEMISNTHKCTPVIFLITDGAVENERNICDVMKSQLTNQGSISPRLYTFGIGSFCNHYFLRMLATMAATCNNICKAATSVAIAITTPSLSTSSSHLLLPSLSLLPKSSIFSRNISTSSSRLTHVVKNPGRVNFRVMSSLSDSDLEDTVKKTISDYPVVVYSKSWCSYSSQVKQLFKKLGVQPHVVELDQLGAQGSQLQDVLGDLTEQYTVPNVFIGAKHIGGCSDTVELYQKGELENLLTEAGAKKES